MHLIAAGWILWLANPTNWPTILAVAAGLGFVIFVHELGHFLVAKACGVKCEKFYVGFDIHGLKLFKFQWGETEYGIGILPLGGYVKMLGQDDNPARYAEESRRAKMAADGASSATPPGKVHHTLAEAEHAPAMTHGDLPPEPVSDPHEPYDPRSYMAQSVPKRMAIISAGVIMNVIFAFIMASVAYALGVKETPCVVRGVVPGGAAWQVGLQPGDVITRISNTENPRFRDLQTGVTLGNVAHGIPFVIQRPGQEKPIDVTLQPDTSLGVPMIGIVGPWTAELMDQPGTPAVLKYSPAGQANPKFEPGDRIVRINDMPIKSQVDVERAQQRYLDEPMQVTVERNAADKSTHDGNDDTPRKPEELTVTVPAATVRDFGLAMTMGPIVAVQQASPAAAAGIKSGDRLESIDGQPVGNALTLPVRMRQAAVDRKKLKVEIARDADGKEEKLTLDVTPRVPEFADVMLPVNPISVPALGIAYKVSNQVSSVAAGSPAAAADIKPGDKIVAAKMIHPEPKDPAETDEDRGETEPAKIEFDEKDPAWPYFVFELLPFANPEAKVRLWVERGNETREVELPLTDVKDELGKILHTPSRGFIFQPLYSMRTARSFGEAVKLGGRETVESLLLVYRFLQKIGQNQISVKLLGGPVEIARQAGMSVQQGLSTFLLFLTMLSANLAVINFLPIPVLDGGHMVFLLYEGIRGKPASERVIVGFTYAGLLFILSLMLFVLSLDLGLISRR